MPSFDRFVQHLVRVEAQSLALSSNGPVVAKLASGADVKHMTADECRKYVKRDVLIERALLRIYRDRFKALRSRGVA